MGEKENEAMDAAHIAILLGNFKTFCDRLEGDSEYKHKIRNILYSSSNKNQTVYNIFKNRFSIEIEHRDEAYMLRLVEAFLNKKSSRNPPSDELRDELMKKQHGVCAFCGCPIDKSAHVDHIVPFKYVGDELQDNYQLLCPHCNLSKNEDLDYQLKLLLNK